MKENVKIEVSQEVRRKIEKTFGVTGKTVSNALNYDAARGHTDLAKKIRVMALHEGGVAMVSLPACECIHDEVKGVLVQTFGNGARLLLDKKDGSAVVFYKGRARQRWEDVAVSQIGTLQEYAAGL